MKKLFVLFTAAMLVTAFAVPAMGADWSFYGNARMTTFSADVETPAVTTAAVTAVAATSTAFATKAADSSTTAAFGDRDTTWEQQGNSRLGGKVKVGKVNGYFEFGIGANGGTVGNRKIYGTWNFGGGKLLVGQTYTPYAAFISGQVYGGDAGLLNIGGLYGSRRGQIALHFGDFKLAVIHPHAPSTLGIAGASTDITIPKIEASYSMKLDPLKLSFMGGYQTYDIEQGNAVDLTVDTYYFGVCAKITMGAAYLNGDVMMGQNTGQAGLWMLGADDAAPNAANSAIIDNDTLGYMLVAGYKLSDNLKVEAGFGYLTHEPDVANATEDETVGYYLQLPITVAKGVYITPEIGKLDYKNDANNADEGDLVYFGAKWMIAF